MLGPGALQAARVHGGPRRPAVSKAAWDPSAAQRVHRAQGPCSDQHCISPGSQGNPPVLRDQLLLLISFCSQRCSLPVSPAGHHKARLFWGFCSKMPLHALGCLLVSSTSLSGDTMDRGLPVEPSSATCIFKRSSCELLSLSFFFSLMVCLFLRVGMRERASRGRAGTCRGSPVQGSKRAMRS